MKSSFLAALSQRFRDRNALTSLLLHAACWLAVLVYLELLLHIAVFGAPDVRFLFVVGFSTVLACTLGLVTAWLPRKAGFITMVVLTILFILLFGSQLVYYFAFGTLYSLSQVQQGGAAVTSFWQQTLLTIWQNLPWLVVLFLPLAFPLFLRRFLKRAFQGTNGLWRVALVLFGVVIHVVTVLCVSIGGTGYFSNHYFYHSDLTTTDQAAERFGLMTAYRLNLTGNRSAATVIEDDDDYFVPQDTQPTAPSGEETVEPVYNVLDIDFDALATMTQDKKLLALNDYCQNITGTQQNEYTGMLSDYNLIVLCAESFATGAIDKDLTPTLYKLSREGFVFNNFYNTFPNNTTDGEYALCTGLFPDASRGKKVASFYASRNSYLPYCLGNIFLQQKGIQSYGYHNYSSTYYGRKQTHANMGYSMKYAYEGMKFTTSWPASDLEMMEQSIGDYIGAEQFHAYYMTFSGHMSYTTASNPMAARNWELVKDLDLSYGAKCYLSCNIELDKAMEYLLRQLEDAGVADKTAIVLVGDHYPYGLNDSQYSELVGYETDPFTKYKSTLIFWVGGMEEPVEVDEYCCNVDILPTILNLWGFSYDSRMLAGTDIFSNGTHMAVLADMSFFTDKVWVNASTGQVRYLVDGGSLPEEYVENMVKLVQTKFSISKDILNTAYYNYVFDQGKVSVNWGTWDHTGIMDQGKEEEKPPEQPPEEQKPTEPKQESTETQPNDTPDAPPEDTPQTTTPAAQPESGEQTATP